MADVVITYNSNIIDPPPLLRSMTKENILSGSGTPIGCVTRFEFEGWLYTETGGTKSVFELRDELNGYLSCPGTLSITCGASTLFSGCGTTTTFSMGNSDNNHVLSAPYTWSVDVFDTGVCCTSPNLLSFSNVWSLEPDQECNNFLIDGVTGPTRHINISHAVSAHAHDSCDIPGWTIARDAVQAALGFDTGVLFNSDIGTDCIGDYNLLNHMKKVDIDETEGTYSVLESWVLTYGTGESARVKEDFTVECASTRESKIKSVSISGSIQGLETSTYDSGCYTISEYKYNNALAYYDFINGEFHDRAQNICGFDLGVIPVNQVVSHQPKVGRINYNYVYDSQLTCFSTGSTCEVYKESVRFTGNNPNDVYAEQYVLGKPCPIFQNLGIRSKGTRGVDIRIVADCGNPCENLDLYWESPLKDDTDIIVNSLYDYLAARYTVIFTDTDAEAWDPITGEYQRTVQYSYTSCCNTGT